VHNVGDIATRPTLINRLYFDDVWTLLQRHRYFKTPTFTEKYYGELSTTIHSCHYRIDIGSTACNRPLHAYLPIVRQGWHIIDCEVQCRGRVQWNRRAIDWQTKGQSPFCPCCTSLMWFKRNGHFAKNEISESEVSNEYSKNQTEFHPRVQG